MAKATCHLIVSRWVFAVVRSKLNIQPQMYVAASRRRLTDVTRVPMSLPSRCALTPHTDFETVARDYVASIPCDLECKDGLVERQYQVLL